MAGANGLKPMISLVPMRQTFYDGVHNGEVPMDALKAFMLSLEQFWFMLLPVFTQGPAALTPLIRAYPWAILVGAFIFGFIALAAFRVLTGFIARLLLLPIIAMLGYLLYSSGSQIIGLVLPLLREKFPGVF